MTALERAFELARSGTYANVSDIREQLGREGLAVNQIVGPSLIRQLRALCLECFVAPDDDTN